MSKDLVEEGFFTKGRNYRGKVVFRKNIGNNYWISAVDNRNDKYDVSFFNGNRLVELCSEQFNSTKKINLKKLKSLINIFRSRGSNFP